MGFLLLAAGVLLSAACSGGSGPEESPGLLRITAADLDPPTSGLVPGGFEFSEVTSHRIQINAGPRVVVDSTYAGSGPIQHEFSLEANSYVVVVEAFQGDHVLLFNGAGEATVFPADTAALAVDLDPTLGTVELTIGGAVAAVVPTNGTASVRVLVRNNQGQPVSGARVELTVDPSSAGTIMLAGSGETGPDGVLVATFDPADREVQGELRLKVDGISVGFAQARSFSVVSPVDANRSTLTLLNSVRLPADGSAKAQILVRIVDAAGVPQPGIPVIVRSSRNGPGATEQLDTIRSDQTVTDGAGEFLATLATTSSSTLAGDAVITAEADGKVLASRGTVTFRSVVDASATKITVSPVLLPADGVSKAQIEVRVQGESGLPLGDILVRLQTKNDSLFQIVPISGRTDGSGIFRATISSTVATSTFIDTYADGLRTSATSFIVFQ